jgi:hypothetical protein
MLSPFAISSDFDIIRELPPQGLKPNQLTNITITAARMPRRTRSGRSNSSQAHLPRQTQNAQRNYARYLELARDATHSGDVVAAENYLQHAEHYLRSMRETNSRGDSQGGKGWRKN